MQHKALQISKLLILVFLMAQIGCTTPAPKAQKKKFVQRVFMYPYDSVWKAALLTLKYPLAINNTDNGVLETEWIRAEDGFNPPFAKKSSSGVRYKILMNVVKGKADGLSSIKVTVNKKVEKQRDFFSDSEDLSSEGLEETVILYRMERELIIEEAIKKSHNKTQNPVN